MIQQRRGGQKAVLAVNGAVAVTLVVFVAAIALVVNPPSPPGIAAFAPQASKPITKAPPGQSSISGNGAGQCAAGQACAGSSPAPTPTTRAEASAAAAASAAPSTTAAPVVAGVPSALQCYSWPDGSVTQTFDPQSPPCVADWPGQAKGNGGSTSTGVTGSTIRIAFPNDSEGDSTVKKLQPIVDFFNTHFELYGRKIQLVPFASQQANGNVTGSFDDPSFQEADAQQASALKVFAAFDFLDPATGSWALPTYINTLKAHQVIALAGGSVAPFETSAEMASQAPYVYSFSPTIGDLLPNVAAMTCNQLVGHPAAHSTEFRKRTRKFAILIPDQSKLGGSLPGLGAMESALAACGVSSPKVVQYDDSTQDVSTLTASFTQLKSEGVTTLLFFPYYGASEPYAPETLASSDSYDPEWVTMGWQDQSTALLLNDSRSETGSTFGVGVWNKLGPVTLLPWYQAYLDAGGSQYVATAVSDASAFYEEMLLLASGIQTAGPDLTPSTFAEGLHSTTFPNPGADEGPSYQARVGFADAGSVMVNDYNAFWLDPHTTGTQITTESGYDPYVGFCYVILGARWDLETWPTQDRYYQSGVCR